MTASSIIYVFTHPFNDGAGGSEVNEAVPVLMEHRVCWGLVADTAEDLTKMPGSRDSAPRITSPQLGTAQGLNNQPWGQLCLSATHQLCQFSHLLDFW